MNPAVTGVTTHHGTITGIVAIHLKTHRTKVAFMKIPEGQRKKKGGREREEGGGGGGGGGERERERERARERERERERERGKTCTYICTFYVH